MSESGKYTIVGMMSGTSLDGLDLALCEFEKKGADFSFKIHKAYTTNYDRNQKNKLQASPYLNVENYFLLHHLFGKYMAKQVNHFLTNSPLKPDAIASHGHTIFHQPKKGFSTQIGCGATIAAITKTTTVCDFRSLDVAMGGQGAPLVPIGDKLLFGNYKCCLNIGGIANISFDDPKGKRVAFDIGVANLAFNFFAAKEGMEFDKNGELASKGVCHTELLNDLNDLDFYKLKGAKSLGREWFENDFLRVTEHYNLSNSDVLCTLVHHCALQIVAILNEHQLSNVFITGGGAHNMFLIDTIKQYYKGEVIVPDALVVNFKEALIFAFLGYLRLTGQINTLCSVTGATADSIGGAVYYSTKTTGS